MQNTGMKRVLVTGGTGFVGSHAVELLLSRGYAVTCLVRDPNRLSWLEGLKVDIAVGDCTRSETLMPALQDASIVIHAAGLTKARRSRDYYEINQLGTRNMLQVCKQCNAQIEKFILISSLAAAGPSRDGKPIRSADGSCPVSDYGKSKLLAEEETLRYRDLFSVVILRPTVVYGPRDKDLYELFRWAVRGIMLEMSGGDRFLNFCYVKDLAKAILLAVEKQTRSGSIYFVAENRAYSWGGFRQALLTTGHIRARTITIPYGMAYLIGLAAEFGSLFTSRPALTNRQKIREAAQKYWLGDLDASEREFGFKADYSLQKGLNLTWRWYRDHKWLS